MARNLAKKSSAFRKNKKKNKNSHDRYKNKRQSKLKVQERCKKARDKLAKMQLATRNAGTVIDKMEVDEKESSPRAPFTRFQANSQKTKENLWIVNGTNESDAWREIAKRMTDQTVTFKYDM